MVIEVINVLCHFLSFAESFSRERAHNMVALMLDPHFKSMDCIMDYIGNNQAAILMQQYDELVVMPLLKVLMKFLNLDQVAGSIFPLLGLLLTSTRLFRSVTSTQEVIEGLFKAKLSLFCKCNVENDDGLDSLIWWFVNESKLLTIGFLAWQILGIASS